MVALGVVLTGGMSRRMGLDKAAMAWHGTSLLQHMQMLCRLAGCDDVVTVGRRGDVADVYPDSGVVGGIHAALRYALLNAYDTMVVVPVDMPLLPPRLLRYLLDAARDSGAHTFAARRHLSLPLACRVIADYEASLAMILQSREVPAVLDMPLPMHAHAPPTEVTRCFANLNETAEYRSVAAAPLTLRLHGDTLRFRISYTRAPLFRAGGVLRGATQLPNNVCWRYGCMVADQSSLHWYDDEILLCTLAPAAIKRLDHATGFSFETDDAVSVTVDIDVKQRN